MAFNKSQSEQIEQILGDFAEEVINYDARMTEKGAPPIRFVSKYIKKASKKIESVVSARETP